MPGSFFVTYGGNRVTLPGTPGSIAWEEKMVDVNLSNTNDYLRMRFVDATGGETAIEVGSGATATASASVPVGATAYWTANGCQTGTDTRYHVTGLGVSGFGDISAATAVTTSFYNNPDVTSYGSARLIATDSASAQAETTPVYHVTFGEGSTNYYSTVSASSWAGQKTGTWDWAGGREMWIPHGAQVGFSASSMSSRTYSVNPNMTALSGYSITYSHRGLGTRSLVTGYLTGSDVLAFRIQGGRYKSVYATGTALTLATASGISAAAWQPRTIITAFSSNMLSGSSTTEYLNGSAAAGLVYGFELTKSVGTMKDSAGTWRDISQATDVYIWGNHHDWVSNSAKMNGQFSAFRRKGGTGNNNATYAIYGKSGSYVSFAQKSGTFALPTASSTTPKTTTQTGEFSLTGRSANAALCFSISVPQNANLCGNCRGAWTASGVVL